MSRYAQVDRSMWVDEKFLTLSAPKPNAQTLFVWLLTSPDASIIPGTYRIGLAGIAEALGWPLKTTGTLLSELERAGMVRVDLKARLVWLPNALKRNAPRGPDNLAPWEKAWQELPECPLKAEVWEGACAHFGERDPKFLEKFQALCPHPYAKPQPAPKPPPMGSSPPDQAADHSRHTNNKILDHDPEQEQKRGKPPAAAPRLSDSEQAVLDALGQWPGLEPLANVEMVRQIRATAAPAGWSPDDVLTGIADLGAKHGMATAASGTLEPGKLATKLSGYIRTAHLARRAGTATGSVGGSAPSATDQATQAPSRAAPVPPRPDEIAPPDHPNRMRFFEIVGGAKQ